MRRTLSLSKFSFKKPEMTYDESLSNKTIQEYLSTTQHRWDLALSLERAREQHKSLLFFSYTVEKQTLSSWHSICFPLVASLIFFLAISSGSSQLENTTNWGEKKTTNQTTKTHKQRTNKQHPPPKKPNNNQKNQNH